jgi:hypothetical protein
LSATGKIALSARRSRAGIFSLPIYASLLAVLIDLCVFWFAVIKLGSEPASYDVSGTNKQKWYERRH